MTSQHLLICSLPSFHRGKLSVAQAARTFNFIGGILSSCHLNAYVLSTMEEKENIEMHVMLLRKL